MSIYKNAEGQSSQESMLNPTPFEPSSQPLPKALLTPNQFVFCHFYLSNSNTVRPRSTHVLGRGVQPQCMPWAGLDQFESLRYAGEDALGHADTKGAEGALLTR